MGTTSFLSLSGAVIEMNGTTVCKYSPDPSIWERLNEQAIYMSECGMPFVEVLGMAHGRYWLREYAPLRITNLPNVLTTAKESLELLWDVENPRHIPVNWVTAHQSRLRELCKINGIESVLHTLLLKFEEVVDNWYRLTVCGATHGDATLSNIVIDVAKSRIRWIDPIPPSLWLPAFKAIDLAKLLQSAHGWEHFLNNQPPPSYADDVVLRNESPVDVMAARYFHMLCYLRILRYANEKPRIYDYAINKLYDCLA